VDGGTLTEIHYYIASTERRKPSGFSLKGKIQNLAFTEKSTGGQPAVLMVDGKSHALRNERRGKGGSMK